MWEATDVYRAYERWARRARTIGRGSSDPSSSLASCIAGTDRGEERLGLQGSEVLLRLGRPNGSTVEIPAVTADSRRGEAIINCRIYCDMTPVFAPEATDGLLA